MDEPTDDFDFDGADWLDMTVVGSLYEEQIDISRPHGHSRHRRRPTSADAPHGVWLKGRSPEATASPPHP